MIYPEQAAIRSDTVSGIVELATRFRIPSVSVPSFGSRRDTRLTDAQVVQACDVFFAEDTEDRAHVSVKL